MTVRLRVFGGLSITRNGEAVAGPAAQRRNLALLAVLAVHGRAGISRERLGTLLWPESDEGGARGSLKQTVFVVRRELGADVVLGATELRCGPQFPASDLADFESALEQGEWERAVAAQAGPFLDGFHLSGGSEDFERWVDAERDRLARRRDAALETLATRAEGSSDHSAAARWWRLLADGAPLDSRYARGVIRARVALGDPAGALQFVELHRKLLKEELGLPLDAELEQFVATLRHAPPPPVTGASPRPEVPSLDAGLLQPSVRGTPVAAQVAPTRRWRRGAVLAGAALGIAALAILGTALQAREPSTEPRRVAVVAIGPGERDATTWGGTGHLVEAIARHLTTLQLTPVVVGPASARDVWGVGRSVGARYVVSVALDDAGLAEAALTDADSGARRWGVRITADDRASADVLAERAATAVAVRADPAMAGWIQLTTEPSSIAAYRDFSRGLALFADNQWAAAIESLLRASRRDTAFTLPLVLAGLASVYDNRRAVSDSIATVLRHRDLQALERGVMDVQAAIAGMNLDAEYRAALAVAAAAPGSEWSLLLADAALKLGRSREAAAVLDQMGPDRGWMKGTINYWYRLGRALHHMGDRERELEAMTEARRRFPTNRIIAQIYIKALVANGKVDPVLAEVDRALSFRPQGNWGDTQPMDQAIFELRAHGHREGAQRVVQRTLDWLARQDSATRDGLAVMVPTFLYYAGDLAGARDRLRDLAARAPLDMETLALLGVVAAAQGDRATADSVIVALGAGATDPASRTDVLVSRASIAATLGDKDGAMADLRDACRGGFAWRTVLHTLPGFDALAVFGPLEEHVHPVH